MHLFFNIHISIIISPFLPSLWIAVYREWFAWTLCKKRLLEWAVNAIWLNMKRKNKDVREPPTLFDPCSNSWAVRRLSQQNNTFNNKDLTDLLFHLDRQLKVKFNEKMHPAAPTEQGDTLITRCLMKQLDDRQLQLRLYTVKCGSYWLSQRLHIRQSCCGCLSP